MKSTRFFYPRRTLIVKLRLSDFSKFLSRDVIIYLRAVAAMHPRDGCTSRRAADRCRNNDANEKEEAFGRVSCTQPGIE